MLLKSGAEINAGNSEFGTALSIASFRGNMAAVQMLLDHDANVNASSGRLGSAVQAASLGGHIDLVRYLLDKKANVNASGGRFGNALQAASFGTREHMTQALQRLARNMISKGIPILDQSSNALEAAALDAYKWDEKALKEVSEAVLPLLSRRSSAVDSGIRDPLIDASATDRGALVQLLLDRAADPNAPSGEYGSALQAASA
ncbi:hypothetical protein PENANT_c014G07705 [Penicillium antarcticum]|uniref:Uncharacterized protein n=1 Tax=Penicillium antarcticum TaxID=416450 RepID=A0A1V6Q5F8_9EURO|nr:uncharacterized protein N7508_009566 [Penicillium antarcticum]KAJ5294745.1 hypothetical protein N7508_009566 [Penicillium antarcticum]OQD84016.1 hypothetical protein PENANT_c014G07705 [Penicillium antarcticum]